MSLTDISAAHERARRTAKWSTFEPDVLPMWVAEMDFPAADAIIAAIDDVRDRQEFGYPVAEHESGLPEAFCEWSRFNHGWAPPEDHVHLLPDVMTGVVLAVDVFTEPGTPVIVPTPAYMPFFDVPRVLGRPIVEIPMVRGADGRWTLDLQAIDDAFRDGATSIILCQPYNPLGRLFSVAELTDLAEIVDRHGARVAADEIHAPLTYEGRHLPYAAVSEIAASHTVTTTSASKAWNIPGLKCAELFTSNDADEQVWKRLSHLRTPSPSTMGIRANVAAFTEGRDWLRDVIGQLDRNRALLAELLSERIPAIRYEPPEATFLAWLDCRDLDLGTDPGEFFLREARVAFNPGPMFGQGGEGHVRLNLATSPSILDEAVGRMAEALRRAGRAD